MTLEDFSTIMHNIPFVKGWDGTLNNQFIFDLAKKYNVTIIHKNHSYMLKDNKAVDNVLADIFINNIIEFKVHQKINFFSKDGSLLAQGLVFID
jgi:hypothetical protein